jgi:cytochrome c-type biogenesis protein CcmE
MKQKRFWFSLIALCVTVACAAAIVLAIVSATTALAVTTKKPSAEAKTETSVRQKVLKGVVSDTSCSAKHVSEDKTAAECVRMCVRRGAQYALISGERVYLLDGNLAEVDRLAGQRAEVVGLLEGDQLTVRSIRVAE